MGRRYRTVTREQVVGAAVAILDWAGGSEQRIGIDWTRYDRLSAAEIVEPLVVLGRENDRVYNLLRDLRRKDNYEDMLSVVAPLDTYEAEGFYRKAWWQIRTNHLVADARARFGVEVDTFAWMIGCTPLKVRDYEDFHEFINDPAMIHAFEVTSGIQPPKTDEFRRKFKRAMKDYQATH